MMLTSNIFNIFTLHAYKLLNKNLIKTMKGIIFIALIFLICLTQIKTKTKDEWKTRQIYQIITDRFARTDDKDNKPCIVKDNIYCGGTFKGIQNHLDYIKDMGFNAIWISPVQANTKNNYHGYGATSLYKINPFFGTEAEFKELIKACQDKDIWMMVDVVANHMGPVGTDYSTIEPFNKPEHYHDYCLIEDKDFQTNQWKVEVNFYLNILFRTADLPICPI